MEQLGTGPKVRWNEGMEEIEDGDGVILMEADTKLNLGQTQAKAQAQAKKCY